METWLIYALIAFFAFGVANFLLKFVAGKIPTPLLVSMYFGIAFVASVFVLLIYKTPVNLPANTLAVISVMGLFFFLGVFAAVFSLSKGFGTKAIPVFNMNTLVSVVLIILILGEKLSFRTAAGIGLAMISLYLLST